MKNRRPLALLTVACVAAVATACGGALVGPASRAPVAPVAPAASDQRLRLPAPSGPMPVGRADRLLRDDARADPWVPSERRELMVTLWYPAAPSAAPPAPYVGPRLAAELDRTQTQALGLPAGSIDWAGTDTHAGADAPAAPADRARPLLLYSPGAFESRLQGSAAAADLASHGYLVVAVDHTYETTVELPGELRAPRADPDPPDLAAALVRMTDARVADLRFVLDRVTAPGGPGVLPPGVAVDPRQVGVLGHSLGGDTAVAALHADRRVAAAADLDGFLALDSGGAQPLPVAREGVDRPFLLMGSRSTVDRLPAPGETPEWVPRSHRQNPAWRALWDGSTAARFDVNVPEGRHHVFTDTASLLPQLRERGLPPELVAEQIGTMPDPARAVASIHAVVRTFFDRVLRGGRGDPSADRPDVAPIQ